MKGFKLVIFILVFSCPFIIKGQPSSNVNSISNHLFLLDFESAEKSIKELPDDNLRLYLTGLNDIIKNKGANTIVDSIAFSGLNQKNDTRDKLQMLANISKGYYAMFHASHQSESFLHFNNALEKAASSDSNSFKKLILSGILQLYSSQKTPNSKRQLEYYNQLMLIAETCQDSTIASFYNTTYYAQSTRDDAKLFFPSAKKLNKHFNTCHLSENWKSNIYDVLTVYYRVTNQQDSLLKYSNLLLDLPSTNYTKLSKFYANLELAALNAQQQNKTEALKYLALSKEKFTESDSTRAAYSYYRFGAMKVLSELGEYEKAYNFLEKSLLFEHQLNFKENQESINQLEVKIETAEKEKQLLLSEQENKKQQYLLLGLGGLLLLGSFIAILYNRNTKRKQRIAEQEREIEIQKTETLLKEQELTTIDAMIEGQEKERQRLAGDLHDNVGATLAAAKLQFDHLKNNRAKAEITDELFSKTSQLLDDAYDEIRNISHVKNSGVIAKNGLLPAIQKLAKNASANGKLKIEVSDFGLENRIENSLEITLFRVIQELVTNIIKHSKACEASIAITQHEGVINVIIEDNGIGISEEKRQTKSSGMGLENIEKRIEHIDGTFEVDSNTGKGTTIIIDIPANQNTQ